MSLIKKITISFGVVFTSFILMATANAGMVSTSDVIAGADKAELINMLDREDVRKELVSLGVDPKDAAERIDQLTPQELSVLKNQIGDLPAGAGIGNVELLLIIIILILLL